MHPRRPAWLAVDLDAVRANVAATRAWIGPAAGVMAVIKANAYGHGLVPCARAALAGGAGWLGVAIPDEALTLRAAGITARVLVLGACAPDVAEDLVAHDVDAALSTPELLRALSAAATRQGRAARVHVKVDSGMGRVGVLPEDAPSFFATVAQTPGLEWAGLMTHFATADEPDPCLATEQWRKFANTFSAAMAARQSANRPGSPNTSGTLAVHAANSAAVCRMPQTYRGLPQGCAPLVRPGLLTYGIPAVATGDMPPLRPALSLRARLVQVKKVGPGTTVSYGATFVTQRPTLLAIVPLGYADGYSRANSNRAQVLLRGRRVPVLGRVCMDQFVIDATDTGAEMGDEVVLLGRQEEEEITANELAAWSESIHHEVLARMSDRLPRVYQG